MQKIWKNRDKKLEIKRSILQKFPSNLDQNWMFYDFLKFGVSNEIKIEITNEIMDLNRIMAIR